MGLAIYLGNALPNYISAIVANSDMF